MINASIAKDEAEFLPNLHKDEENSTTEVRNKFNGVSDLNKYNLKEVDTYDEGEKDIRAYEEDAPLSVRERKQTALVYETFKEKA